MAQETAEIHTAVSLVAAGLGVTLVPASVQNVQRPGVAFRALEPPVPITELAAVYRREDSSPVLQAFLEVVRLSGH